VSHVVDEDRLAHATFAVEERERSQRRLQFAQIASQNFLTSRSESVRSTRSDSISRASSNRCASVNALPQAQGLCASPGSLPCPTRDSSTARGTLYRDELGQTRLRYDARVRQPRMGSDPG
jgi:hypothetical protein